MIGRISFLCLISVLSSELTLLLYDEKHKKSIVSLYKFMTFFLIPFFRIRSFIYSMYFCAFMKLIEIFRKKDKKAIGLLILFTTGLECPKPESFSPVLFLYLVTTGSFFFKWPCFSSKISSRLVKDFSKISMKSSP